ncbi:MAG: polysaccharide deacetylase family protein [Pseudomonadales bacterium]|nr:polysaccharide deacetylase family protein [Pseudomonadales bacterium]
MMSKRLMLARLLNMFGVNFAVAKMKRNFLIVLNYHRIADHDHSTEFDNDVFEHSVDVFREQMVWLKQNFEILDEIHLVELAHSDNFELKRNAALVTFDDGYADNYTLAYPILKELGMSAIFYVPYSLIEDREVGWWDKISWLVYKTTKEKGNIRDIDLDFTSPHNRATSAKALHKYLKLNPYTDTKSIISELSEMLDVELPSVERQSKELMTWEQLKEVSDNGISVGSHSMSHRLLSQITEEEQSWEIKESKTLIESRLGKKVNTIAYPVGAVTSFNDTTKRLVKEAGYDVGFSFYPGSYKGKILDKFDIQRISTSSEFDLFKNEVVFPKIFF